MSYILDALKKSEEERQSQQNPTIKTVQRGMRPQRRSSQPLVIFLLALCIALVGIAVYLGLSGSFSGLQLNNGDSNEQPTSPSDTKLTNSAIDKSQEKEPAQPSSGDRQSELESESISAKLENRAADPIGPTVAFAELPDNVRNEIPALTFSFHVYSAKATSRTIIINNRRVKEGDEVSRHLVLEEITREGVVMRWKRHRFFINVVESW